MNRQVGVCAVSAQTIGACALDINVVALGRGKNHTDLH
jgi:hypothetical protein